jgi:hypothetical protein
MSLTKSIRKSRSILILPLTVFAFLALEIVAILIIRGSIADWQLQSLLQERGIGAEAVVTRLDEPAKGMATIEYQFIVTTSQGNEEDYYGYAEIPGPETARFQPGMNTAIIYDPDNPERSRLEDPPQIYSIVPDLLIVIAAFIGTIAIAGAGIRLLLMPGNRTFQRPGKQANDLGA